MDGPLLLRVHSFLKNKGKQNFTITDSGVQTVTYFKFILIQTKYLGNPRGDFSAKFILQISEAHSAMYPTMKRFANYCRRLLSCHRHLHNCLFRENNIYIM